MTEQQDIKMGFVKIPYLSGDFDNRGQWKRALRRPIYKEYWDPERPNTIRREFYTSPYQARTSYRLRESPLSRSANV